MSPSRRGLSPREDDIAKPLSAPSHPESDPPPPTGAHSVAPEGGFTTHKRQVSAIQARVIDSMYATLTTLGDHELLGVRRTADPLEVRCAYESLLAAFHPRRFERTSLGEHACKLDAILARIHEAYHALSTPEQRASYDARFGKPDS